VNATPSEDQVHVQPADPDAIQRDNPKTTNENTSNDCFFEGGEPQLIFIPLRKFLGQMDGVPGWEAYFSQVVTWDSHIGGFNIKTGKGERAKTVATLRFSDMTSREWRDLGFREKCPITSLDAEKLSAHEIEYRLFVAAQKLRKQVANYLTISSDGWVPREAWNAVQLQHRELYQDVLVCILGAENSDNDEPIRSEEDLNAIWPFDL
jgi:hypothetical protein